VAFKIQFAESVAGQLQALTAAERSRVLAAVAAQLAHEPLVETRNRKPLRPNPLAPWELRVGPLRVF
jgi:mRNA-degrading endonuclease RelE of RelBE toxin-antitoxin system